MMIAGLGGFVGTCGRYLTGVAAKRMFGTGFPFGTFIANVVGCFIIGLLFGLLGRHEITPAMNAFLITGFCGGFTTFSSFSHDMYSLLQKRQYVKFVTYMVLSLVLGMLCVYLGMRCI